MKDFYYIPRSALAANTDAAEQIVGLAGAAWDLTFDGLVVEPNSLAHIRACLFNVELLKGRWEEPAEV